MEAIRAAASDLGGIKPACEALGASRATHYRRSQPKFGPRRRPSSPRALSADERAQVLETLNSERFGDQAPSEVHAALLDEGRYQCSVRTMYRILEQSTGVRERRDQLRHPHFAKPELRAAAPNQVWSWDITKLLGPTKWSYYYLYVILDIYSRYVVGWLLAHRESAELARRLILETCAKESVEVGQLGLHADRGPSMTSKTVAQLLADLGITKTHSRPHVSNDNPFSESQFKTMKYRPDFPDRVGSLEDGRSFCIDYFDWYNNHHHHSGLGFLTPAQVHHGLAPDALQHRQAVLERAYDAHPERFPHGAPAVAAPPSEVWINPPQHVALAPAAKLDRGVISKSLSRAHLQQLT
jgi:putative transposase